MSKCPLTKAIDFERYSRASYFFTCSKLIAYKFPPVEKKFSHHPIGIFEIHMFSNVFQVPRVSTSKTSALVYAGDANPVLVSSTYYNKFSLHENSRLFAVCSHGRQCFPRVFFHIVNFSSSHIVPMLIVASNDEDRSHAKNNRAHNTSAPRRYSLRWKASSLCTCTIFLLEAIIANLSSCIVSKVFEVSHCYFVSQIISITWWIKH